MSSLLMAPVMVRAVGNAGDAGDAGHAGHAGHCRRCRQLQAGCRCRPQATQATGLAARDAHGRLTLCPAGQHALVHSSTRPPVLSSPPTHSCTHRDAAVQRLPVAPPRVLLPAVPSPSPAVPRLIWPFSLSPSRSLPARAVAQRLPRLSLLAPPAQHHARPWRAPRAPRLSRTGQLGRRRLGSSAILRSSGCPCIAPPAAVHIPAPGTSSPGNGRVCVCLRLSASRLCLASVLSLSCCCRCLCLCPCRLLQRSPADNMLGSVLVPSALHSHATKPAAGSRSRRNTYTTAATHPSLPPRRNSLSTAPAAQTALQLKSVTLSGTMESRYHRSSSPRRAFNPARASTGTFADPYASSYDYASYRPTSPRASADRLSASTHHHPSPSYASYAPTTASSSAARTTGLKYDAGYGLQTRPRRNTEDRMSRPNVASLTSLPLRTPFSQDHRPSSPLAPPRTSHGHGHGHGDTYITHGSSRQDSGVSSHKKIYSVDSSHTAKLVAETDTIESPRHRDSGYGAVTSGRSSYHPSSSSSITTATSSKPSTRHADLGDNGYSYTDAAGMYRDTEPAWRRPRAGSVE